MRRYADAFWMSNPLTINKDQIWFDTQTVNGLDNCGAFPEGEVSGDIRKSCFFNCSFMAYINKLRVFIYTGYGNNLIISKRGVNRGYVLRGFS